MRTIQKGPSPADFEAWKAANQPKYWNELKDEPREREPGVVYFLKKDLRKSLIEEQRRLCCYCQTEIDESEKTKIEHFFPKDGANKTRGTELMFDYQNLHAACNGGESEKGKILPRQLHCDSSKKEKVIGLSPLEDLEKRFEFLEIGDGKVEISSVVPTDSAASDALKILNLNCPKIQKNWGEAVRGLVGEAENLISKTEAVKKLEEFEALENADPPVALPRFFGVKKHFLKRYAGLLSKP